MNIVGLKELRENMSTYVNKVQEGQSFVVLKKSQPIFKITPIEQEENWETVVDFTKIKKGGVNFKEVMKYL